MKYRAVVITLLTVVIILQIANAIYPCRATDNSVGRYTLGVRGGDSPCAYVLDTSSGRLYKTYLYTDVGEVGIKLVRTHQEIISTPNKK